MIAVEEATRKKQGGTATGGISERFPEAQDIAIALSGAKSRASAEITRTKAVYGEAFDAYREFDRHYVSHVLSFFIEDRLLVLRSYLRQTLNPIGQVIYLGSNAQKPG